MKALDASSEIVALSDYSSDRVNLSICYDRLGDLAYNEKDYITALSYYKKNMELSEGIWAENNTVNANKNLSISLVKVGRAAQALGNMDKAELMYMRSVKLLGEFLKSDNSLSMRFSYSVSLEYMGYLKNSQKDLSGAWEYQLKCVEIREGLISESRIPSYVSALKTSYDTLIKIALQLGKTKDAEYYTEKQKELRL